jgi:hypothetical protein
MQKERRKQERFDAQLFVELDLAASKERIGRGVVVDVSLSGLAVDTEIDLKQGMEVGCHIEVPIYLKAKVMRTIVEGQLKRYGLKFTDQSILDKFILKKMLRGSRRTKKIS